MNKYSIYYDEPGSMSFMPLVESVYADSEEEAKSKFLKDRTDANIQQIVKESKPEKSKLKYLQDMTKEDFEKVFNMGLVADSYLKTVISRFSSLHGWALTISQIGEFHSWDTARDLGYDVNFTLPIKKDE